MTSKPRFIDPQHVNENQIPPPYQFGSDDKFIVSDLYVVRVSNTSALEKICERFLNIAPPDELRFRPLSSTTSPIYGPGCILIQTNYYPYISSSQPDFRDQGFLQAKEVVFTLPVENSVNGGPYSTPSLFFPYIFIDQPWSVVGAMAIFGFMKQYSQVEIPQSFESPTTMRLSTYVYKDFSPATPQTSEIVLANSGADSPGATNALDVSTDSEITEDHIKATVQLPFTTLKQFRDAEEPQNACYQALVSSNLETANVGQSAVYRGGSLDLKSYASLPIIEDLGLAVDSQDHLQNILLRIRFTWEGGLSLGKILYSAQ